MTSIDGTVEGDKGNEPKEKTLDLLVMRKPQWSDEDSGAGNSTWLVSFTDVVALMLTFFVLLYAMSDPVQGKWDKKLAVMEHSVADYSGAAKNAGVNEGVNINQIDYKAGENIDYIEAILGELLNKSNAGGAVSLTRIHDDLMLSIERDFFNEKGKLKRRSSLIIKNLSSVLNSLDNQIVMTSNATKKGNAFRFRRAQIIGAAFKKSGYKKPIKISLRGDFKPQGAALDILIRPHDGRRITR